MIRWLAMQLLMTYHHNFVRHLIEGNATSHFSAEGHDYRPYQPGR